MIRDATWMKLSVRMTCVYSLINCCSVRGEESESEHVEMSAVVKWLGDGEITRGRSVLIKPLIDYTQPLKRGNLIQFVTVRSYWEKEGKRKNPYIPEKDIRVGSKGNTVYKKCYLMGFMLTVRFVTCGKAESWIKWEEMSWPRSMSGLSSEIANTNWLGNTDKCIKRRRPLHLPWSVIFCCIKRRCFCYILQHWLTPLSDLQEIRKIF